MKYTAALVPMCLAGTQAFVPTAFNPAARVPTPLAANPLDHMFGQKGSDDKKEDMWEEQQELLKSRREHSGSKADRKKKYAGPNSFENDAHDELKHPWSKDNSKDDHNSAGRKL